MQNQPENKAQKLAGRITLIAFTVLTLGIAIPLYFDKSYSINPKTEDFSYSGLYIVKEKLSYQGDNSYYEDTWTKEKYSNSSNTYEVYSFTGINNWYDISNVKFNSVNFNINDTIYLYYKDSYSYKRKDSNFIGRFGNYAISINEARKRNIKLWAY